MIAHEPDPLPGFSALLRGAMDDLAPDAVTFLQMLSDDAVMEFPFAPKGMTDKLEGRAAIGGHVKGLGDILEIESLTAPVVLRDKERGLWVLEFKAAGKGVQSGNAYNQDYISVITVRDGRIVHYRDYWNPLVVLETLSSTPAGGAG